MNISDAVRYVGVNDYDLDLFESQYMLEKGMAYNSYLILDDKVALMDSVDKRGTEEWLSNVERELSGRKIDYIVISHMEPDHSGSLFDIMDRFPEAVVVGNAKTFAFMGQFSDRELTCQKLEVKEGDELCLGSHTLKFTMAPMVHWPEVMMTYESSEKLLFSADAFGKFGTTDADEDWACEARRYYFNIVGKYGVQVQGVLKKLDTLDVQKILPLHGPVLTENLGYYIGLYRTWSAYEAESKGVFVLHASIHGNTAKAAEELAQMIRDLGEERVVVADLCREDMAECVEDAFRHDRMILCCATYDGGAFVPMEDFLHHLQIKGYRNRTVGLLENGTWAPQAVKSMRAYLESMKDINILPVTVSIKSSVKDSDKEAMQALAQAIYRAGE